MARRFDGVGASRRPAAPRGSRAGAASSTSAAASAIGSRSSRSTAWRTCSGTTAPGSIAPACSSLHASSRVPTSMSRSTLKRSFDLALCLEVAQILGAGACEALVEALCRSRDVVVFSAADPGTGRHPPRERAVAQLLGRAVRGRGLRLLRTPFASHSGSRPTSSGGSRRTWSATRRRVRWSACPDWPAPVADRTIAARAPWLSGAVLRGTSQRPRGEAAADDAALAPEPNSYLRSLFDSMSNHIAKSVNWLPEISSSATRTIVGVVISFPIRRRTTSTTPSRRPTNVIRIPSA